MSIEDKKNKKTAISILMLVVGMFCLAFASVPLYSLFCKVTGFGGTPRQVEDSEIVEGKNSYEISFNTDLAPKLNWSFKPGIRKITTKSGKRNLVYFEAKNLSDKPLTGVSTFNVVPESAGQYFSKIECFCYEKQTLDPGQKMNFPVSFYIDPEIETNPETKNIKQITLSYSFFEAVD